jgi:hypothetical protein
VVTDDIVTRLRQKYAGQLPICTEAADEIERLRGICDMLANRLRSGSDSGWDDAIDAWEDVSEFGNDPESQGSAKLSPNSETNVDDTIQSDSVKSLIHDVNKASKGMSISDMDNPGSPIRQVIAAFTNPGQHPEYHEYRKAGLRKEWPALWAALNKLVDEYQR